MRSQSGGDVATWLVVVGGLAVFALSACGGNTTNGGPNPEGIKGGEAKYDASAPVDDTVSEGGVDSGSGITWTDLYRDFFGNAPQGAGCNGDGKCHGDASLAGAQGSGGFVCGDKNTCFAGLTGSVGLVQSSDKAMPQSSYLVSTLRHKTNGVQVGSMPKRPAGFVFTEADIARIGDWIAAGAQNN